MWPQTALHPGERNALDFLRWVTGFGADGSTPFPSAPSFISALLRSAVERGTLVDSLVREDVVTPEQVRALAELWWLAVAVGLLSLIAGGLVVARPDHSLRALAVIIGIFVLIDGAVEVYLSLASRVENRATTALLAILNVIVGVLLIRHPLAGVQATALFIGIWLIAVGVLHGLAALDTTEQRLARLVVATVEIIAGVVVVASPNIGYAALASLVGLSFVANGIAMIVFGILLRTFKRDGQRVEVVVN